MASAVFSTDLSGMDRNDSGATIESPFGSGLATPIDEGPEPFKSVGKGMHGYPVDAKQNSAMLEAHGSLTEALNKFSDSMMFVSPNGKDMSALSPTVSNRTIPHVPEEDNLFLDSTTTINPPGLYTIPNASIIVTKGQHNPDDVNVEEIKLSPMALSDSNNSLCATTGFPSVSDMRNAASIGSLSAEHDTADRHSEIENLLQTEDDKLILLSQYTLKDIPSIALKILCFFPWCLIVGAAILLSPRNLEAITFTTGYLPSYKGIHRFAHWSDCAGSHVGIFFASLLAVLYWNLPIGALLAAGFLGRFMIAWQDFKMDTTIPLGTDDRQSLYLVARNYMQPYESLGIKRTDNGFLLDPFCKEKEAEKIQEEYDSDAE